MRRALLAGISTLGLLTLAGCSSAAGAGAGAPASAAPSTAASAPIEAFIKGSWHCSQPAGQYLEFNMFGSTFSVSGGKVEGEATFTDTTFRMGAADSFLTGTWSLKDGAVILQADDAAPKPNAPTKTTTVGNFPTSTAQLNDRIRVSLQSASTNDQPYNYAYIQANGPKSVVITGAQNRQANCTKD